MAELIIKRQIDDGLAPDKAVGHDIVNAFVMNKKNDNRKRKVGNTHK